MPAEYTMLQHAPLQLDHCPHCDAPWQPFLRGMIQRWERKWWLLGPRQPYCAMICWSCKDIVGYEDPLEPLNFELVAPK